MTLPRPENFGRTPLKHGYGDSFVKFFCLLAVSLTAACTGMVQLKVSDPEPFVFEGAKSLQERPDDGSWILRWDTVPQAGVSYEIFTREISPRGTASLNQANYEFSSPAAVTTEGYYISESLLMKNNTCFVVRLKFTGYADNNQRELCTGHSAAVQVILNPAKPVFTSILFSNAALDKMLNAAERNLDSELITLQATNFSRSKYAFVADTSTDSDCAALQSNLFTEGIPRANDPRIGADGSYKICVELANESSEKKYGISAEKLIVDTTPPTDVSLVLANMAIDGYINASESSALIPVVKFLGTGSTSQSYSLVSSTASACDASQFYTAAVPTAAGVSLTEGSRKICVRAEDAAGNFSYAISPMIIVDKTPPAVNISSASFPAITSSRTSAYTVTYSETGSGLSHISLNNSNVSSYLTLTGATADCSATVSGTGNSTRTISITGCSAASGSVSFSLATGSAVDVAGNSAAAAGPSTSFSVINELPNLTITNPLANESHHSTLTLQGGCAAGLTVTASVVDGGTSAATTCSAGNTYSIALSLSGTDGKRTIAVSTIDAAQQTVLNAVTVVKDTTPPEVDITPPSTSQLDFISSATFTLGISDANSLATVSSELITLSPSAGVSCNKSISGSGHGPFVVTISQCKGNGTVGVRVAAGSATDNAGNASAERSSTNINVSSGWYQEAYIKAANADEFDTFGSSVSVWGNTLAVAAIYESSNQMTITNGTTASADNSARYAGAVYVYRRNGVTWAQEAYLKAANADAYDQFGTFVALSGDTLAVAAYGESSNQTTITNGSAASSDNSAQESGAVYVYRRSGVNWTQEAYVKAANAHSGDNFGIGVSLTGDTLAVGAWQEGSNQSTITNGSTASSNSSNANSGAVYVYRRSGVNWAQEAYVKAANSDSGNNFGVSVSLSGDTLAVGSHHESSNQTTITNGTTAINNSSAFYAGAVYLYRRSGVNWAQEAYVKAANADSNDEFGISVSLSGDTLAVGAWQESSNQRTITNGTTASADNSMTNAGAVYVYRRTGVSWAQEAYVKAANADSNDVLGLSVSLAGDTLAVGAYGESSNQTMITHGSTASADNSVTNAGTVYVYRRSGLNWAQEAYVKASNTGHAYDAFGIALSLSGDTLAVGAQYESSNQATITHGTTASADTSVQLSGAVFVYRNFGRMFDTDVRVTGRTTSSITFEWHSNLGSATQMKVAPASMGAGSPAAHCSDTNSITLPAGTTSYTFSGLNSATKYGFRFCAWDGSSASAGTILWADTDSLPPEIASINSQSSTEDVLSSLIPMTISDSDGPSQTCDENFLSYSSSNTSLVPAMGAITWGGSWPSCTAQVKALPNANGSSTITIYVTDGFARSAGQSFTLTVSAMNDTPSAISGGDTALAKSAGAAFSILLGASTDPDVSSNGQALNYEITSSPSKGSLEALPTVPGSGTASVTYTPSANVDASDSFSYRVCDNNATPACTAVKTVSLTLSGPVVPLPRPPDSFVPRINSGGVADASNLFDTSGLGSITQPSVTCGTSGSVESRIADCKAKNPSSSEYNDTASGKYWWQLVTRTGAAGKILWRDGLTGLIWSDTISSSANWCQAAGSNNKSGSPWAEVDSGDNFCDNATNQSQTAPVSLCAEDSVHLNGTTTSHESKGGLGVLSGASTAATWWLPSIDDFRTAADHGASKLLPGLSSQSLWSSSVKSGFRSVAWIFNGVSISMNSNYRDSSGAGVTSYAVRCVASAVTPQPAWRVPRINSGGLDSTPWPADGTNASGLGAISQPSVSCGTSGNVESRISDCKLKNPTSSEYKDIVNTPQKYWWQLVTRTAGNGKILWRDRLTGLIWSDTIPGSWNWCQAAGSSNKSGSPWSESDVSNYCSSVTYQDQSSPTSLCAEDATNLNGTTTSHESKGGLGGLTGATDAATWWLPSLEELRSAFNNGAAKVLPGFSAYDWWSSTVVSSYRNNVWNLSGNTGSVFHFGRYNTSSSVRCVGR